MTSTSTTMTTSSETSSSTSTTTTSGVVTTGTPAPDFGAGAGPCGHDSPEALMHCVEQERYAADVAFVAHTRTPGSKHWYAVRERCLEALDLAGFEVELQDYGTGINVIGTLPGTTAPGEVVLLGAHYDHIADCPGADDNASGVAGALEVARVLGQAELARTVVVACWDQEEVGLQGSRAYAGALTGAKVVTAVNFDMIGYASAAADSQVFPGPLAERFPGLAQELVGNQGRGDFIAVTADPQAEPFALELEARAEGLGRLTGVMALTAEEKLDEAFGLLAASDHVSFWERGIPAVHVSDTGVFRNPAYHCLLGVDAVEALDHAFATDVIRATTAAIAATAGL